MEEGLITAVAMNGAGIIHDFELAFMGHTSEEVDDEIDEGRFGMAEETGRILNEAIAEGHRNRQGLGEAVGRYIHRSKKRSSGFPYSASNAFFTLSVPTFAKRESR